MLANLQVKRVTGVIVFSCVYGIVMQVQRACTL